MTSERDSYYTHQRADLSAMIDVSGARVLELGCASGSLARGLLRSGKAAYVDGIEVDRESAQTAAEDLRRVWHSDLNDFDFDSIEQDYDLLVAADVLEHLQDPWVVLSNAVSRLESGGLVLLSVPNIRYYRVLYDLSVKGRFEYVEDGILDRTHLRFFTRHSVGEMLRFAELSPVEVRMADCGRRGVRRVIGILGDASSPQVYALARKGDGVQADGDRR